MKQQTKFFEITSKVIGDSKWSDAAGLLLDWFFQKCLLEGLKENGLSSEEILAKITNNQNLDGEILEVF